MSESIDVIKSSHEWITGTFFLDFSKVCHGCHDFMQKDVLIILRLVLLNEMIIEFVFCNKDEAKNLFRNTD